MECEYPIIHRCGQHRHVITERDKAREEGFRAGTSDFRYRHVIREGRHKKKVRERASLTLGGGGGVERHVCRPPVKR